MKKTYDTSIRHFLENAPKQFVIEHFDPVDLSSLTQEEIYSRVVNHSTNGAFPVRTYTLFEQTDDGFRLCKRAIHMARSGKTIFPHCTEQFSYVLKGQKLQKWGGSPIDAEFKAILEKLNILWCKNLPPFICNTIVNSPHYFKALLTGKIHSEESFWKEYAKKSFHIDHVDWKVFRDYVYESNRSFGPNINDLRDFTKNPINSMKAWLETNYETRNIMKDILNDAIQNNITIDFAWSIKRLTQEHLRLTREKMQRDIASKEQTPVHDNTLSLNTNTIEVLNTEARVFEEGMMMHHCIYTCYWNRIKRKDYLGLHMSSPQDCTIGVHLNYVTEPDSFKMIPVASLDQIYLAYDRSVNTETRQLAEQYIKDHNDDIVKLLCSNKKVKANIPSAELSTFADDLPM